MLIHNKSYDKKKIPWLRLALFVLLLAIGSGTLLILRPLQTHPMKHYLLSGKTVFAFEGGRKLWQRTLPGSNSSFPSTLLIEDNLYIAAGPVYALDKETSKILWQRQIPLVAAFFTQEQIATSLFWKIGKLYVETDAQWPVQLDPQTGTILWEYADAEAEISPPAFSSRGDVVYVVTRQQRGETAYEVAAMSAGKREFLWQQHFIVPAQWGKLEAPVVQDELLLVPLGETVVVLRTSDGHLLSR